MNKSCSIFFYAGYVGVSPTIANTAIILNNSGYLVNIYGRENKYPKPGELGKNVKIFYFRQGANKLQFLNKIGLKDWITVLQSLIYAVSCMVKMGQNHQLGVQNKNINIAVDVYGAVVPLLLFYLFKQKFLFLSLELRESERFNKFIYGLSKLAYQKSECAIVQDEDRFQTLCEQYEYQHPQVFYLPNSPLGTEKQSSDGVTRNYFRDKFNLSQEEFPYIILQAGMIDDTVLAKPLARTFASLDNGCALVFHDRFPKSKEDQYIKALLTINSKNLFLSLDPVPYDQVDQIFASSTICLAFYSGHNDDYSKMVMASGKLAHSLKLGKPVLVSDLPSLSKLINHYQCGMAIKDPSDPNEMKSAIEQIISNYDTYSNNAKACFAAEFDFSKKIEPILSFMEKLSGSMALK